MKTADVISKFEKKGYKIVRDMNSSEIVVTPPSGFTKIFTSYNAAYNYYFSSSD